MRVELGGAKKILGEKKAKPGKSDAGKNWEFGCMSFWSSLECGKNWGMRRKGVVGSVSCLGLPSSLAEGILKDWNSFSISV